MPITYSYNDVESLVEARAYGLVTTEDLVSYVEKVSNDPIIKYGFIEVIDASAITDIQIPYDSAQSMVGTQWDAWLEKGHQGSIAFAPSDLAFGVFRMTGAVLRMHADTVEVPRMVTRDESEIPMLIKQIQASQRTPEEIQD